MSAGAKHLHGDRPAYLSACKAPDPFPSVCNNTDAKMNSSTNSVQRVIGLDSHPDSFTAAILGGPTPASAIVEKMFNKIPMAQLAAWAKKHTMPQDLLVLEASGNSFQVVRSLAALGRKALVLESCHLGKLKEAHANNDKISAIRIGKAYLSGTAKIVWVPDQKTQERRDWFHAHRKASQRTTQLKNRAQSYLSDNGVRLKTGTRLTNAALASAQIKAARDWSAAQWQIIEILLADLEHAEAQRKKWRSLIAQEVLSDPALLSLVRLCGIREMTAFALGAFIGDIRRFENPKKLVKYAGLNPAFDDSGNERWSGGIGGHGNKHLRGLLIEGAHAILRCAKTDLAKWGKKLLARKSQVNIAVAAVARKLTVAAWHSLMGRTTPAQEIEPRVAIKISKIITAVGKEALAQLQETRQTLRQKTQATLQSGRVYILGPVKNYACAP
jgi:transposase